MHCYTNYSTLDIYCTPKMSSTTVSLIGQPMHASSTSSVSSDAARVSSDHEGHQKGFQKLLKAEAIRRVRMCNLQSAKDCVSVLTSEKNRKNGGKREKD
ncbi:hypothetical protein PILCRDRAFT_491856 [Piloderma croceum F 1598]|uniref:Uncharacterized protein n=1 Tax=Piloderma croceum (strain F 1598) TaxID=765440 RepID=A0A0C3FQ45_PILCF|nr:hypothetical protein PILCRDRAFT_491856 [Piloderma croceum F 1598]